MARRIAFLGPRTSLLIPAGSDAELRIPVAGMAGFVLRALQGSIDRSSLSALATSPIQVRQFDVVRNDGGRLVSLVRNFPNFVEVFGQDGHIGEVPKDDGEAIQRGTDVVLLFRNLDLVAAHTIDVDLRGLYDTALKAGVPAEPGVAFSRSLWQNGAIVLPVGIAEPQVLTIRLPNDGHFTLKALSGIVNEIPFGVAGIVPVQVEDFKVKIPNETSVVDLMDGVRDFLSFVGQNGSPATLPQHEVLAEGTDVELTLRNVSGGLLEQRVSITLLGTVEGSPKL
jgi:hypothetical protein